jgi:hypothetical protein
VLSRLFLGVCERWSEGRELLSGMSSNWQLSSLTIHYVHVLPSGQWASLISVMCHYCFSASFAAPFGPAPFFSFLTLFHSNPKAPKIAVAESPAEIKNTCLSA